MAAYFTTESFSGREKISFRVLQTRLIKAVNWRIHNGEFTERGLAKLVGISQPQIHNVLKGARKLNVELADRLLSTFNLNLVGLLQDEEIAEEHAGRQAAGSYAEVPGPASPVTPRRQPQRESHSRRSAATAR